MKSNSETDKKSIFEIVGEGGVRIDELGEATQSDGARFYSLAGIDKWLSTMKFEFTGGIVSGHQIKIVLSGMKILTLRQSSTVVLGLINGFGDTQKTVGLAKYMRVLTDG